MWTLRLRGPKGKAATVQIHPESSLGGFCDLAVAQLAIKGTNLQLTLRSGFPPRPVEYSPDDVVQTKFANNDTVVVDTAAPGAEPHQAVADPAATAASSGRAATRGVAASVAKASAKAMEPVRGVHSLHGGGAKPKAKPAIQKRKNRGDGVRLGESLEEESVIVDPAPTDASLAAHKYRRTRAVQLTSKDDIGIKLIEAVSGKSKDRVGKFFRAATKSAVDHQYEMTIANARLQAALGNKFEVQEVSSSQPKSGAAEDGEHDHEDEDAGAKELRVRFKESVRKWKEETVMMLQPMELQAAVKYILISGGETGREMLKPFNMAQLSPRVFWNIARLYNGDVAAGLAALVPDEDWSYLDTRAREMSKKAVEAKANEEAYKRWQKGDIVEDEVSAGSATRKKKDQDVILIDSDDDKAGGNGDQKRLQSAIAEQAEKWPAREEMARAAAARVEARARAHDASSTIRERITATTLSFQAVAAQSDIGNADGEDEDEDLEQTTTVYCDACNKARVLSLTEAAAVGVVNGSDKSDEASEWTCASLKVIEREGSCDEVDDEVEQIAGAKIAQLLQKQSNVRTRQDLANATLLVALRGLAHPLESNYAETKTKLSEMIDEARLDEVNDAIAEIVGDDALVNLLELQKLGTPADLAETPVDLIASAVAGWKEKVDINTVIDWQEQARDKVTRFAWMGEWRTV